MGRTEETTVLTEVQTKIAGEALNALMNTVTARNPELAKVLKRKYIDDELAFSSAAKEACPSNDPAYWAKSSCNKCYGRGIMGQLVPNPKSEDRVPLGCRCIEKSYRRWLAAFRLVFNEERDNGNQVSEHETPTQASGSEDTQEA